MTDKQIIGGRGSAKSYTTLNTIEVMLENEKLKEALKAKERECEELKKYLNQIRDEELSHLDIEWDEYETSARQEDYSNIITLVERALGEIDD